jgi:hypothetical protein
MLSMLAEVKKLSLTGVTFQQSEEALSPGAVEQAEPQS